MYYLGFDPGRDKCGVAVLADGGQLAYHEVIPADQVTAKIPALCRQYAIQCLIMGNQTTAKQWQQTLQQISPPEVTIIPVDERNSSVEARARYWQMYPPRGLQRLLPQGLRVPPRPIDDIVAILLIERFWAGGQPQ
ncbi:pre-16S rRNA-processing nuclease YqgF [Synechocystis sp. LKSZ1]|uniref:pre-16S rRNA-processing nuclease YqgF n=1 Tax=Synechocystis sp. LKSZ1 TaxID=3144951 RepID=UPI00336BCA74